MSLDFDKLDEQPCEETENVETCSTEVPPSDDERCADPAFADANPELCKGFPRLIIKPAYAIVEPGGQVQYKTYLRTAGDEVELTSGLTYSLGNPNIGFIEPDTGLFTGTAPGIT